MLKYFKNFLLNPFHLLERCQFNVVTAAIIAGAAGLIGSGISASGSKSAAAKASDANLRAAQETNALNEKLFNQSRGAAGADGFGHSILPVYFGGNEEALGRSAFDNFNRLSTAGNQNYGQLLNYQGQLNPALNTSLSAFANRFNGQDLGQRVAFADPFYQARLNQASIYGQGLKDVAAANSSAINTGLAQTLGRINAQRAAQGFLGGSTFDRNRLATAMIQARQQAAIGNAQAMAGANGATAGAQFENANDLRAMQLADLDFKSRLDAFPGALGAVSAYQNAPVNALAGSFNTAMQPLNYFRIAPQAFQAQGMPMQEPGINNAQIFGNAISQAGQAYGNYALMSQLQNRYGTQPGAANPSNAAVSSMYNFSSGGSMAPNYSLLGGGAASAQPSPYFNYRY